MKISNGFRRAVVLFSAIICPSLANASFDPSSSQETMGLQSLHAKGGVLDSNVWTRPLIASAWNDSRFAPILVAEVAGQGEDAQSATSESAPALKVPDIGGTGVLDYNYDLAVPSFHGVEPKIVLNYASTRKTKTGGLYQGWLGYGWGLKGFDVIERARPKSGIPAFNKHDVFLLNGEELVLCKDDDDDETDEEVAKVDSASCKAGGTHVSETENYLKIVAVGSNVHWPTSWKITNRQGVQLILKSVGDIAGFDPTAKVNDDKDLANNYRWLVSSVTDTNGNKITYDYSCDTLPVCYPKTITYGNGDMTSTVITFSMGSRADHIIMANGHTLSTVAKRITAIKVVNPGAAANSSVFVSAWGFEYDPAPGSGASRLIKISRFGSDASVSSGVASAPTAAKVTTFNYSDAVVDPIKSNVADVVKESPQDLGGQLELHNEQIHPMDLNSDGITELVQRFYDGNPENDDCKFQIYHSPNLDGQFVRQRFPEVPCQPRDNTYGYGMDFVYIPMFHIGHFGVDPNKTQMLLRDGGDKYGIPPEVYKYTQFNKNGNSFETTQIVDCDDLPKGNIFKDNVCGVEREYAVVLDANGDSRDTIGRIFQDDKPGMFGVANLYDDGRQQRLFRRSVGVRSMESDREVVFTTAACTARGVNDGKAVDEGYQQGKCAVADFNGDGLDDIVEIVYEHEDNGGRFVRARQAYYLFTGDRFQRVFGNAFPGGLTKEKAEATEGYIPGEVRWNSDPIAMDRDGDGRSELYLGIEPGDPIANEQNIINHTYGYDFSYAWRGFRLQLNSSGYSVGTEALKFDGTKLLPGDYNGDGLTDFIGKTVIATAESPTYGYKLYRSRSNVSGAIANLLTSVKSEMGAKSSFEYTPSTAFANDYLPFALPTVTAVTVSDGRGSDATTTYKYSGGYFNVVNRKFLGFKTSTKTLPNITGETAGSPYVITTYRQDVASYGMPEKEQFYDGGGVLKKIVDETYAIEAGRKPYHARSIATLTTLKEGDITRRLKTERSYDSWYGNITEERKWGLVEADGTNIPGDEVRTVRGFIPNTDKYIVSLPYSEMVYSGMLASAPVVSKMEIWYGGVPIGGDANLPPNTTNVMQTKVYRGDTFPNVTTFAYDTFGNKERETVLAADNVGKLVETLWEFKDTQNVAPTKIKQWVTGDIYLTSTIVNNPICQQPWQVTDPNSVVTEHTFDVFCRETKVENLSTNASVTTSYVNDGNPATQKVVTDTPLHADTGNIARTIQKIAFYDGLGRTYKSREIGDASSPSSTVDVIFDLRGNVEQQSLPYADGGTPLYTNNRYDSSNRLIRSTTASGHVTTWDYALATWTNTENAVYTDHPGTPDANSWNLYLGQVTENERINDSLIRMTQTTYSPDGDAVLVRVGETADVSSPGYNLVYGASFDDLRRLTRVRDPGGAEWSYTYDLAGNRRKAKDPDLGEWSYVYDKANRLTTQTDARTIVTEIAYDGLGRPLTRKAGGLTIAINTYDEVRAGAFNKGQLTSATNGLATADKDYAKQTFDYDANGMLTKKVSAINYADNTAPITHTEETAYYQKAKLVASKTYDAALPGSKLLVGENVDGKRWFYNAKGQLRSIPGFVKETKYELDGQTDLITY
jgi:YD repeat-containing protein